MKNNPELLRIRQEMLSLINSGHHTLSIKNSQIINWFNTLKEQWPDENSQWIPCSEWLPDMDKKVLVYAPEGTILFATMNNYQDRIDEFLEYYSHWMPLPEPPEVQK